MSKATVCFVFDVFESVSASVQLLEQTARLQNLSDALDKLKVFALFCFSTLTTDSGETEKKEETNTFPHLLLFRVK